MQNATVVRNRFFDQKRFFDERRDDDLQSVLRDRECSRRQQAQSARILYEVLNIPVLMRIAGPLENVPLAPEATHMLAATLRATVARMSECLEEFDYVSRNVLYGRLLDLGGISVQYLIL